MKKALIIMLSLVIATCVCGCDNDQQEEEITTTASTEPAEPEPYPFFINDVEITSCPEKVVCLSPALTEIICEMGYRSSIIGRSSYCDYPEAISAVQDVGSSANPDIDAIVQLKPDLVITSTPIASKDIFSMEQKGIKTLIIPSPTTLEGFSLMYSSIGLVYEGMFTGKETGEQFYSETSKLLGNTENIKIGNFVYITENLAVAGGNTFESAVLSCFGTNLAKEGDGYSFDTNALLENQPDILIVNSKHTKEMLGEHEIYSELDAFKNDKIIYLNNLYFERPSSRISEVVKILIDSYNKLNA